MMILDDRKRWLALIVLCLGDLMIVLDVTVVNVALPSIRSDLGFSEANLAWVVNAYLLTFGGFLLLGGRLGDLYGPRRLFLIGVTLFTLASLACGLATSQWVLVAARAFQGFAGAIVSAVGLALLVNLFREPDERARAMGVFGFVSASGGSLGVFLGGILTQWLGWHWIFLVNVPIGIAVLVPALRLLPAHADTAPAGQLDIGGAVTITLALLLAVYAIVNGNDAGWLSRQTLGCLSASLALLAAFLVIESRVAAPLMPLGLFRSRSLALANVIAALWAAALFAWFFLCALFLQLVLRYSPLEVGLAFLPTNLIMAALSLGLSAVLVARFGVRVPLVVGMVMAAAALVLFARAPADAGFLVDVLPGMVLIGIAGGIAFNPLLLAAMGDVDESQSGLASGLINTAFMIGGALGLAILASIAAARTTALSTAGESKVAALGAGYHAAFLAGALMAAAAAVLGIGLPRRTGGDRAVEETSDAVPEQASP